MRRSVWEYAGRIEFADAFWDHTTDPLQECVFDLRQVSYLAPCALESLVALASTREVTLRVTLRSYPDEALRRWLGASVFREPRIVGGTLEFTLDLRGDDACAPGPAAGGGAPDTVRCGNPASARCRCDGAHSFEDFTSGSPAHERA